MTDERRALYIASEAADKIRGKISEDMTADHGFFIEPVVAEDGSPMVQIISEEKSIDSLRDFLSNSITVCVKREDIKRHIDGPVSDTELVGVPIIFEIEGPVNKVK